MKGGCLANILCPGREQGHFVTSSVAINQGKGKRKSWLLNSVPVNSDMRQAIKMRFILERTKGSNENQLRQSESKIEKARE